jgi:RNA polymerase sigma factor (sigma-70 family)
VRAQSTWWTQIRVAASGEPVARSAFVRGYEPVVRAYLVARWARTPMRAEVDDAVQDAFLECFREGGALEKADPQMGSFRAFLFGVLRNVALRAETRRARRKERPAGSDVAFDAIPSDEASLSVAFERAWARSVMRQAAERQLALAQGRGAPAIRRVELLRLRFEEGLPIREIAARWKDDPALLHREYARARREFRQALVDVVREGEVGADAEAECARLIDLLGAGEITE